MATIYYNKPNENAWEWGEGRATEMLPQLPHNTKQSRWMVLDRGGHRSFAVESALLHPGPSRDGLGQQSPDSSDCILLPTNPTMEERPKQEDQRQTRGAELLVSAGSQGELLPVSGPQIPQPEPELAGLEDPV